MRLSVPHASVRAPDGVMIVRDDGFGVLATTSLCRKAGRDAARACRGVRCAVGFSRCALMSCDVEAGCPRDGVDLEEDTIPMEARLEDAISMTKGCYVGQEVIAQPRISAASHILRWGFGLALSAAKRPAQGAVMALRRMDVRRAM